MKKALIFATTILIIALAGSALAYDALFESRVDYRISGDAKSIAMADLDDDGDLDIAAATSYYGLFLLSNDGEGGYEIADSMQVPDRAYSVAAGDLDNDGDFDLLIGGAYDTVYVLRNNGGWSFTVLGAYAHSGSYLTVDIEAVDIDQDNDLDAVFTYRDNLCVMRNNGDATFGTIRKYATGTINGLAFADIDGDNDIDIAGADYSGDFVRIFVNDNDTTFVAGPSYAHLQAGDVKFAKFNSDDDYDLVVVGYTKASVYFNNGSGAFTLSADYPTANTYPIRVEVADLDGDADPDFAVIDDYINVFLNTGDGTFDPRVEYVTGAEAMSLAIGDVDGDLDVDIATGNSPNSVGVFFNEGDGSLAVEQRINSGTYPAGICAGDFDNDGNYDIAATNYWVDTLAVFFGNGDRTFDAPLYYPVGADAYAMIAVNLNNDAYDDIVVADTAISVFLSNGDGSFAPMVVYACPDVDYIYYPTHLDAADIDSDGNQDIIVGAYNYVQILNGVGDGTLEAAVAVDVGYSPGSVDADDINDDGYPDLVLGDDGDYYIFYAYNNGDGTFGSEMSIYLDNGYYPIAIAVDDFNGDGYNDIVAGTDEPALSVFLNNGDSTWQSEVIYYEVYEDIYSLLTHDFDKDGDIDLVVNTIYGNALNFFENDGTGTFTRVADYGVGAYPWHACMADFDNDNAMDIAVTNLDLNNISLLWNRYEILTSVDEIFEGLQLPQYYMLSQNYPNPFNPNTIIEYELPQRAYVTLTVFNVLGQQIRTLVDREQAAGEYQVQWDGQDSQGREVATGLYFYRLQAGNAVEARKMILLK